MSEPLEDEAEVLDGLPVLPEEPAGVEEATVPRTLAIALASPTQAAAAAVGGFVAGAALVGLAHRRHSRRAQRPRRLARGERTGKGPVAELVQVVASRSLLVDVHLLGSPSAHR